MATHSNQKVIKGYPTSNENDVNIEILNMLKLRVIQVCKHHKGWNLPILAVEKSDPSVRICCNFKETINKCLRDDSEKFDLPAT